MKRFRWNQYMYYYNIIPTDRCIILYSIVHITVALVARDIYDHNS